MSTRNQSLDTNMVKGVKKELIKIEDERYRSVSEEQSPKIDQHEFSSFSERIDKEKSKSRYSLK